MKINFRIGGLITSIAAGVLFASSAIAVEGGVANDSYVGDSSGRTGIYAFDLVDNINLLAVPGITLTSVQEGLQSY